MFSPEKINISLVPHFEELKAKQESNLLWIFDSFPI